MDDIVRPDAGGLIIRQYSKGTPDGLMRLAVEIAGLAGEIWREHYTPIIGAAQVEYMLEKFQSADRIYSDIINDGYVYFTAEPCAGGGDGPTGPGAGTAAGPGAKAIAGPGAVGTAESARAPAGYCAVVPQEDRLLLSKLYVRRERRGTGVGRRFIEEAAAPCAKSYGLGKIRLTVNKYNEGSILAYKKLGFSVTDSVKTDIGGGYYMDDYIMDLTV